MYAKAILLLMTGVKECKECRTDDSLRLKYIEFTLEQLHLSYYCHSRVISKVCIIW